MKPLLWITYVCTGILVTHNTLCMEPEYSFLETDSPSHQTTSNKRFKSSHVSKEEQKDLDYKLLNASLANDITEMKHLISCGANINSYIDYDQDENVEKRFNLDALKKLNPDDHNNSIYLFTPLSISIINGYIDQLNLVIRLLQSNLNEEKYSDELSIGLATAFIHNNTQAMSILIDHGADTNYLIDGFSTPLLLTIHNKTTVQSLSMLLNNGADITIKNEDSMQTALHIAATCGNNDAVELLIARNAPLFSLDDNKETPLQVALQNNNPDTALCILKHCMPSHDLYPADAYKKLKILLLGFYKKDEYNPSVLNSLPTDLLHTIIAYTPELIFNKKLLTQIISRNRYNKPSLSNCSDDAQEVQYLLESIARVKLDEPGNTVVAQFKSSAIFVNNEDDINYDTSSITDLEKKRLLDALFDTNTPDNHSCYQKLVAMKLWDDVNKKNVTASSKNKSSDDKSSHENASNSIDRTHNNGKQEE